MTALGLQKSQLAGAGNRFGSPLDLQLVKDDAGVSLDRAQSEEEPFADFSIRKSLSNESQHIQLALAQRLDERASGWLAWLDQNVRTKMG